MTQLRKRSRDARANREIHDELSGGTEHRFSIKGTSRRGFAALIVLISILVAAILFLYTHFESTKSPFPISKSLGDPSASSEEHNSSRLHPEDHIFRKPSTLTYKWRITSGLRRPDGVLKQVYLINDDLYGPTIECRSGDRLVIEVENGLESEGLSMHWHGLSMRGFNKMDGAVGFTNTPISAGASFIYDFRIDNSQHGTFWYHAHDGIQRAEGLFGGLIVHKPKSKSVKDVDVEHVLAIGDWYHRSGEEALDFYMHPGAFGNEPVPDSLLLNGVGAFNCSDAVPARPLDCELRVLDDLPALILDRSKRNVLRIINVGSYAGISLSLTGAHLKPFAVDGGSKIAGQPSRSLEFLQPGERVDVIVEPNDPTSVQNSTLEVKLDDTPFKYPNPALTTTHFFAVEWKGVGTISSKSEQPVETFNLENLKAAFSQATYLPKAADQTIVLYAVTQRLAHLENEPHGFINHTSWRPQTPASAALISLGRDLWDKNQFVPFIQYSPKKPLWVDIVLNNLDEESHPFHLHGYDFWVLSKYSSTFNWGSYNPFEDEEPPGGSYDLIGAVKKDTVYVPRRGYAVLRVKADNPGIWMFHCHVLWHQASGMAMAFEVGG